MFLSAYEMRKLRFHRIAIHINPDSVIYEIRQIMCCCIFVEHSGE